MIVYIISFTENGDSLNDKIQNIFKDCEVRAFFRKTKRENLTVWTKKAFTNANAIIFIGAAGIAVRAIAPYIKSKDKDPAVIVCDELQRYVIPILSGHIGGANAIALKISESISAKAVITTATDINDIWAVDSWAVKRNFKIYNTENIKYISSALLRGEKVGLFSDVKINEVFPENVVFEKNDVDCGIVISPYIKKFYKHTLNLIPKCLSIGVGSRKNADKNSLVNLCEQIFKEYNINKYAVSKVATINLKKNETSVLKLCEYFGVKLICFTSEELNEIRGEFSKSEFVKSITGTDNICERCAVLASGFGRKIIDKTVGDGVTLSIALCGEV